MNGRLPRTLVLATSVCAVLFVFWLMLSPPRHPVALIRVVDTLGRPVAGAVIRPDGLRTKPGPYQSGHYGWRTVPSWPTNHAVRTDRDGYASVPYPKYVFERIETGQISFSVNHQDFVPDRPFRTVTTLPPARAPWRVWVDYSWTRIRRKALIARADPVVLQKGAILQLAIRSDSTTSKDARLFAQVSGLQSEDPDFWVRPEPAVIVTRRLAPGQQTVRAVRFRRLSLVQ